MEDPAFPEALMREARLASPELEFTQLDNGLRIVSSDRQVSRRSVGAVSAKKPYIQAITHYLRIFNKKFCNALFEIQTVCYGVDLILHMCFICDT